MRVPHRKSKVQKNHRGERGIALLITIMMISLLMLVVLAVAELIIVELRSARRVDQSLVAYYAAEAGIEDGLLKLTNCTDGTDCGDPAWASGAPLSTAALPGLANTYALNDTTQVNRVFQLDRDQSAEFELDGKSFTSIQFVSIQPCLAGTADRCNPSSATQPIIELTRVVLKKNQPFLSTAAGTNNGRPNFPTLKTLHICDGSSWSAASGCQSGITPSGQAWSQNAPEAPAVLDASSSGYFVKYRVKALRNSAKVTLRTIGTDRIAQARKVDSFGVYGTSGGGKVSRRIEASYGDERGVFSVFDYVIYSDEQLRK